jgi:alkanesulfonate monooxygenase SsuD/methylene tetrahydromethanopterin reductase-like flavin-dependent oxidoreductase (luciferase family)
MSQPTGLLAFWKGYDRKLYVDAAVLADRLGYDSFWLPEVWGYEVFSLLTEIALKTKRIKLGTGIVNVYSRSPALIAMQAATLDEISGGRLILGLGTSGKNVIEGFHGRPFTKPLSQLQDVIRVVRTLLNGDSLADAGATLTDYRPFKLDLKPPRRHVPIYVAALKQKSIEGIGELADGWMPVFWPYDKLNVGREWIEAGAKRAGRNPHDIVTAPFTTAIPLLGDMATDKARDLIAFYVGGMGDYYKELLTGFGFGPECDRIAELWADKATRKDAARAVTPEMIEVLTISGNPLRVIRELRRRRDFGLDLPILTLPPNMPKLAMHAFIVAMAPRIWP